MMMTMKVMEIGKIGMMESDASASNIHKIIKWVFRYPLTTQLQVGKWYGL